jgi:LacI family transcriptional regulator
LAASDEDPSIEAAQVEMMTHHPVDGILLVPADSQHRYLKPLASGPLPVVTIDRPMESATTDSVGVENRAGARMAVEHLIQHGNKRITCAAANTHLLTIKERIAGYRESMRQAKLSYATEVHLSSHASARAALSELFSSRNRPEALFTANNASTIWVIEALKEMKIEMCKDVALVGFDDVDFYTLLTPPITAVRQPTAELGSISARLLLQRIKGEFTASSLRTILPVTLVIRESCGCKRGK